MTIHIASPAAPFRSTPTSTPTELAAPLAAALAGTRSASEIDSVVAASVAATKPYGEWSLMHRNVAAASAATSHPADIAGRTARIVDAASKHMGVRSDEFYAVVDAAVRTNATPEATSVILRAAHDAATKVAANPASGWGRDAASIIAVDALTSGRPAAESATIIAGVADELVALNDEEMFTSRDVGPVQLGMIGTVLHAKHRSLDDARSVMRRSLELERELLEAYGYEVDVSVVARAAIAGPRALGGLEADVRAIAATIGEPDPSIEPHLYVAAALMGEHEREAFDDVMALSADRHPSLRSRISYPLLRSGRAAADMPAVIDAALAYRTASGSGLGNLLRPFLRSSRHADELLALPRVEVAARGFGPTHDVTYGVLLGALTRSGSFDEAAAVVDAVAGAWRRHGMMDVKPWPALEAALASNRPAAQIGPVVDAFVAAYDRHVPSPFMRAVRRIT